MPRQWGERHDGAFGFVAPTGRELGKIEEGRHPCRTRRYRAARQAFACNAESSEQGAAPAKEAVAKGLWEARQAGLVAAVASRSPDPLPVRKCMRGPKTHNAAPSGAHRQMRGTECVPSPAPLIPIASRPGRFLENCRFLLDRNSNLKPSRRDTRKRAGTAAGPCPAECLRIRRAFRHGRYERPGSRDAGAARCSRLRRPRDSQARHPR